MVSNSIKWGMYVSVSSAMLATGAQAQELLLIDLTVPNQVSISATAGLSAVTASGGDSTGVLFADFFTAPTAAGIFESGGVGDLTNVGNPSDGSPGIFNSAGNTGFNFWTWSSDVTVNFTAGQQAFTGSATWVLDAADYNALLSNNGSGDIYFPADTDDDIPTATILGTYRVVPAPASAALLGLGGLAAVRRRR